MKTITQIIVMTFTLLVMGQILWTQTIFEAVEKGDLERVQKMVTANPDCIQQREGRSGGTPLHTAAYGGHLEIVQFLIEKGMDPNGKDNDGDGPLLWAVFGKHPDIMDELIKHGADVNPPIRLGRTILHLASANGDRQVIEYLLKKDLPINIKCSYGNTPLFWAVMARNCDNADALISNGAELNVINNSGHTPLSMAVSYNDTNMVRLLLEKGADVKVLTPSGDTQLHAAAYDGHAKMVSLLLEKGADPNKANSQDLTALDLAVMRDHQGIEQILHSSGGTAQKGTGHSQEQLKPIGKLDSGLDNPVKVTIIYDNYVYKEGMEADWGFSCLIEGTDKTILFDTGTKSDLFVTNLKKLNIDPGQVDVVVISHEHGDHTGGLFAFLEMNSNLPVMMPHSFSYHFVSRVKSFGAEPQSIKEPVEICHDVFLSGELGNQIKEQSLAINTKKGLVVICGCSHPGIIHIIQHFKETLNRDIYMALGGFHLMRKTEEEMNDIISQMKALGVQKCGATHCTGDDQIEMFKEAFGSDYVGMGVGRVIEF